MTKGKVRENAQSHSPSGLGAGSGTKESQILPIQKVKKGLRVVNAEQKNPYLNNVFNKNTTVTQTT